MEFGRLKALVRKEFIQVLRDRITLAIIIFMPFAQLLIFGFAINTDVKHLATAIFDQSRTQESREMITSFTSSNYFDIKLYAKNISEVNKAVESGKVKVALVFPPDYAKKLRSGRQAQVQVLVDATDNMSASSALAAAQTLGMLKSQELLEGKFKNMGMKVPPQMVDMRIRPWYNPDFITSWYIVPGIMGLLLTLTLITMMAMAIVR
ncbi:MAG: ABC transporter permease, partial [Synergistaceae bacterium]